MGKYKNEERELYKKPKPEENFGEDKFVSVGEETSKDIKPRKIIRNIKKEREQEFKEAEEAAAKVAKIKDEIKNSENHVLSIEDSFEKKYETDKKQFLNEKDDSQELKDASNKYKRGKNSKYTYKDRPEGMKVVEKNHRVRDFLNKIIGK